MRNAPTPHRSAALTRLLVPVMVVLVGSTACTGSIDDMGGPSGIGGDTGNPGNMGGTGGMQNPTPPQPNDGWGTPPVTGTPAACLPDPGPAFIRRLSNLEYQNSLRDLLGETQPLTADFPQDQLFFNFDNSADGANVSPTHALNYKSAAEKAAANALAANRRTQTLGCDLASGDKQACLKTFVEKFGRRAYRRPLTTAEVDALVKLAGTASADADPYMGARLVLEAMLQSPNFLFRAETGIADPRRPGLVRLTGFEVATRLSYMLLRSTPPDALLDAAAKGELDTPQGIETRVLGLLKDPKALDGLRSFYSQWLKASEIDDIDRDTKQFPAWNDGMKAVLKEEIQRTFDPLVTSRDANFLDFLTTRDVWVEANLAKLYGVPVPAKGWAKAQLDGVQRAGLLTMASILAPTANGSNIAMPIHRGAWVREALFCTPTPPIPANVPDLPEDVSATQSDRERLEAHDRSPACAGCHALFDPIGFGLSNFDAIGAWRTKDSVGKPIDARGTITDIPNGTFEGGVELGQRLRNAPQVGECVVRTFFRYSQGRDTDTADQCTVEGLTKLFSSSGNKFQDLVLAFLKSDAFRYRQPASAQKGATK
jgi:hypothetical protein